MTPEAFAKEQLEIAKKSVEKWEFIIKNLNSYEIPKKENVSTSLRDPQVKRYLIDRLIEVLTMRGRFMTGRELYEAIDSKNPYSTFSAQIGMRIKNNGSIGRADIDIKDNSKRYWYGLKAWFDENSKPKKEYLDEIIKRAND